jgi:hypothetical protein
MQTRTDEITNDGGLIVAYRYALLLAFVYGTVSATPFVVSDAFLDTRVTHCGWSLDGTAKGDAPLVASACKLDLAGTTAGSHTISAVAVALGTVPGYPRLESPPATLDFVKPATPAVPSGLAIAVVANKPTVTSIAVSAGTTHCGWVVNGAAKVDRPVANAKCQFDVSSFAPGSHTMTVTALLTDPVWGRLESAPSLPFSLNVPTLPTAPAGLGLVP